ncbi:STAS domain-containing protein [Mycobacterium sp. MS1601]|uniref:STAS domain-containing protein n=1 Tax=Mycobacterium sp. MS1601 TaxID=1936029 RepID=UPI00178CB910|nr:STAS domain-containing protein [Mycobacterium sp. MS1601]
MAWHDDYVAITVDGDIDAANAEAFARFAIAHIQPGRKLQINLTQLDFFGTAGFSALHAINVRCAAAGTDWTVSACGPVARVLRICDPNGALPVRHSS